MNDLIEAFNGTLTSRINKSGPVYRLSFEIDRESYLHLSDRDLANGIWTIAILDHDANGLPACQKKFQENSQGELWSSLIKRGYFYNPRLLDALGGDDEYRKFLQKLPSAYSGKYSEYVNGEGRSVVAHVRRSGDSGTGYKPKYSAIPLTFTEHQQQHQNGEESLKERSWWEKQVGKYIIAFVKYRLCKIFNTESISEINWSEFILWADNHNVEIPNVKK